MEYVTVCEEPVDQFSKFKTHNPLQLSYENPNRHAGFTQLHIIRVRANHYDKIRQDSKKVMLMERSLYAPHIFTETMYEMEIIHEFEKDYLLDESCTVINEHMRDKAPVAVDSIFFLDTNIDVCKSRIARRSRPGEEGISDRYLKSLKGHYETYLQDVIDCGKTVVRSDPNDTESIEEDLFTFIHDIVNKYV